MGDTAEEVLRDVRTISRIDAVPMLLRIDCTIDVPTGVTCDRGRLQQLASNLLSNALAHGAADRPVALTTQAADGRLVVEVANDGEPIPPDSLSRVFAPFWRNSTSASRKALASASTSARRS
jgi:signal transduction histidine kinase